MQAFYRPVDKQSDFEMAPKKAGVVSAKPRRKFFVRILFKEAVTVVYKH